MWYTNVTELGYCFMLVSTLSIPTVSSINQNWFSFSWKWIYWAYIFFISFTYRYVVFQIAGGLVRTSRDPEFNVCIPYSTGFVQSELLFYNLPFFDHLFLLQIQCNIDTCWTSKTGSVAITMMTSRAETAVIASACLK